MAYLHFMYWYFPKFPTTNFQIYLVLIILVVQKCCLLRNYYCLNSDLM